MTISGLVHVTGAWQPEPSTAELMAEAVDEAVEFIVSMVEAEGSRDGALVLELVRAVDDRTDDAERRMAERASGEYCEAAVAELRLRRERLEALRSRGAVRGQKRGRE